jgi:hypothetical protein
MPAARSRARTEEAQAKPRADAYVGLLGLSLAALIVAMLFAYLNWDTIKEKPKQVPTSPPAASRPPATPGPGATTPQPGQMQPGNVPTQTAPGGKAPPPPPTPPQKK